MNTAALGILARNLFPFTLTRKRNLYFAVRMASSRNSRSAFISHHLKNAEAEVKRWSLLDSIVKDMDYLSFLERQLDANEANQCASAAPVTTDWSLGL